MVTDMGQGTRNREQGATAAHSSLFPVPCSPLLVVFAVLLSIAAVACGGGGVKAVTVTPAARTTQSAASNGSGASSGPIATIEPHNGPPGTAVTVEGKGWPARAQVTLADTSNTFATVTARSDGSFCAHFRLDKTAAGADLKTGRLELVVRTEGGSLTLPFTVESPRPVRGGLDSPCAGGSSGG